DQHHRALIRIGVQRDGAARAENDLSIDRFRIAGCRRGAAPEGAHDNPCLDASVLDHRQVADRLERGVDLLLPLWQSEPGLHAVELTAAALLLRAALRMDDA